MHRRPPGSTRPDPLFPSTTLFRSGIPPPADRRDLACGPRRRLSCRGRDAAPDSGTARHRRLLRRRPGAHAGRWVVIRIRAAGAEVVAAIARIHVESWRDTYAGLLPDHARSEEHTSELQSLMIISYAC